MRPISVLLWIALAIAAAALIYVGWQRRESRLRLDRTAQTGRNRTYSGAPDDAGTAVKITQFYARSGEITDGEQNVVCYGVRNASSVRIEPPVATLSPALTRCISIQPHQYTTYQLIAEGADGGRASESFRVRVRPAPPAILMLAASSSRIRRGDAVTLCYKTEHARAVRLEPIGWSLVPADKGCSRFYPKDTRTYTLVASGDGGAGDRKTFSVEVR